MANEISWSNLETNAGLAHILSGEVQMLLGDPTDIRSTLMRMPFRPNMGSETMKTPQYDGHHIFAAATSELVGGASNQSIGSSSFSLTVSRRLIKWQISDLWQLVVPGTGNIDIPLLAETLVRGTGLTITALICDLFPSLSNAVGSTSGNDMSLDYHFDAQYQLNLSRAGGVFTEVLRPKQFNELQASIRAEGGTLQFQSASAEMIRAKGPGYKGNYGGVDIYDTDSVDADGGASYYQGAMYTRDCFAYTEAPAAMAQDYIPVNQVIDLGALMIEFVRDGANALTDMYGNYYPAVVEMQDAAGVEINSQVA